MKLLAIAHIPLVICIHPMFYFHKRTDNYLNYLIFKTDAYFAIILYTTTTAQQYVRKRKKFNITSTVLMKIHRDVYKTC